MDVYSTFAICRLPLFFLPSSSSVLSSARKINRNLLLEASSGDEDQSAGVARKGSGRRVDTSQIVGARRRARGPHTWWNRDRARRGHPGKEPGRERVRPPALVSRDSAVEKPEVTQAAEAVAAHPSDGRPAPRPPQPRDTQGPADWGRGEVTCFLCFTLSLSPRPHSYSPLPPSPRPAPSLGISTPPSIVNGAWALEFVGGGLGTGGVSHGTVPAPRGAVRLRLRRSPRSAPAPPPRLLSTPSTNPRGLGVGVAGRAGPPNSSGPRESWPGLRGCGEEARPRVRGRGSCQVHSCPPPQPPARASRALRPPGVPGDRFPRSSSLQGVGTPSRRGAALAEPREGASGRGGRLWERGFSRGSGAGPPRSPRFAPSLGLSRRRAAALCVPPATWARVRRVRARLCRYERCPEPVPGSPTSRNSQKLRGGERRTHPLPRNDLEDFESPLPRFSALALLLLSSPFDKWWGWERRQPGAAGRGPSRDTRFPPARTRRGAGHARGSLGSEACLGRARSLLLASPRPPPLSPAPTPHGYRELSGESTGFLWLSFVFHLSECSQLAGVGRGNGSRLACTLTPRPSAGLEVSPGAGGGLRGQLAGRRPEVERPSAAGQCLAALSSAGATESSRAGSARGEN
ncbi:translation initiation factor IF-2 [Oryctolagus cuniculus]|uniref:translation initiation factor IF-2 n=1 Tax=Oryctolagus cuniculus TaxID=9986 RepID=UPI003879A0FB